MFVEKLLLTMGEDLRFKMWSMYDNGTFILKSTNYLPQPYEPPCTFGPNESASRGEEDNSFHLQRSSVSSTW